MDFDELIPVFWIAGAVMVVFVVIFSITYNVENVPLRIWIDGKEVYHGRSGCVETESIGSSARIDIKEGPWCLFPKECFSGKDLVIKTERNN